MNSLRGDGTFHFVSADDSITLRRMKWAAIIGYWGTWIVLTAICSGFTFIVTVFTSDSPANRAIAERLLTVTGVMILIAIGGGITSLLFLPDWRGWLIACGLAVLIPITVFILMSAWMPK